MDISERLALATRVSVSKCNVYEVATLIGVNTRRLITSLNNERANALYLVSAAINEDKVDNLLAVLDYIEGK